MFKNISLNGTYRNLFNGEWIEAESGQTLAINSPVDGTVIGKIQALSQTEVDAAINNCKTAQRDWGNTPFSERAKILYKAADLLEEHTDELAKILELEIAKDTKSAVSEVKRTADFIRFTADIGKHMDGETLGADTFPGFKKNKVSFVTRVPLGVVLAISPFNYPVNLSASKIAQPSLPETV